MKDYLTSYLSGIMNMASSLSKSIGPSYAKVDCYDKKNFKKEFCNYYKIKEEDLNLIDTPNSLETTLLDWFIDEKEIVESITYWFNLKDRGEKKVYLSDEKLVNLLCDKRKDFYFLDDLFFVECNKKIYVFLLGNNE